MKRGVGKIIFILFIIVLIAAIYFTIFYYKKCDDLGCFNSRLAKCSKANFQYEGDEATWYYKILGKEGNQCEVYTELRQLKQGRLDIEKLEGQSMNCFLALGVVDFPEKDISKCHGLLKESLQDIIIQKLHNYILGNLGEIDRELNKVI